MPSTIEKDFKIIRVLRDDEESSSWIKSQIVTTTDTGKMVIASRLNKDKIIKHYSYIPNPELAPPDDDPLAPPPVTVNYGDEMTQAREYANVRYKEELQRFLESNRKALGLTHPNIVGAIEIRKDTATGEDFVVREFYNGDSIYDMTKGLLVEGMIPIFLGVIDAVDFIHRKRLLHLNLKPMRIRVVHTEYGFQVKLTDFGYAADFGKIGDFVHGVPAFSAPEVIFKQKEKIGETSDLYSIGAIMYYCMTRALPFPLRNGAKSMDRLIDMVEREHEPMKPSDQNPAIIENPTEKIKLNREPEKVKLLEELVMGLIKKEPSKRTIKTARDLQMKITGIFQDAQSGKAVSSATFSASS